MANRSPQLPNQLGATPKDQRQTGFLSPATEDSTPYESPAEVSPGNQPIPVRRRSSIFKYFAGSSAKQQSEIEKTGSLVTFKKLNFPQITIAGKNYRRLVALNGMVEESILKDSLIGSDINQFNREIEELSFDDGFQRILTRMLCFFELLQQENLSLASTKQKYSNKGINYSANIQEMLRFFFDAKFNISLSDRDVAKYSQRFRDFSDEKIDDCLHILELDLAVCIDKCVDIISRSNSDTIEEQTIVDALNSVGIKSSDELVGQIRHILETNNDHIEISRLLTDRIISRIPTLSGLSACLKEGMTGAVVGENDFLNLREVMSDSKVFLLNMGLFEVILKDELAALSPMQKMTVYNHLFQMNGSFDKDGFKGYMYAVYEKTFGDYFNTLISSQKLIFVQVLSCLKTYRPMSTVGSTDDSWSVFDRQFSRCVSLRDRRETVAQFKNIVGEEFNSRTIGGKQLAGMESSLLFNTGVLSPGTFAETRNNDNTLTGGAGPLSTPGSSLVQTRTGLLSQKSSRWRRPSLEVKASEPSLSSIDHLEDGDVLQTPKSDQNGSAKSVLGSLTRGVSRRVSGMFAFDLSTSPRYPSGTPNVADIFDDSKDDDVLRPPSALFPRRTLMPQTKKLTHSSEPESQPQTQNNAQQQSYIQDQEDSSQPVFPQENQLIWKTAKWKKTFEKRQLLRDFKDEFHLNRYSSSLKRTLFQVFGDDYKLTSRFLLNSVDLFHGELPKGLEELKKHWGMLLDEVQLRSRYLGSGLFTDSYFSVFIDILKPFYDVYPNPVAGFVSDVITQNGHRKLLGDIHDIFYSSQQS